MSRKKKSEINTTTSDKDKFVYCGLRHCPHRECLRHNVNTPFGVIIYRKIFNPDKDWNCKDMEV